MLRSDLLLYYLLVEIILNADIQPVFSKRGYFRLDKYINVPAVLYHLSKGSLSEL